MNISYIIPLYNEENTVNLCIDAIMSQMDSDDEIIVVDNGSTDNSINNINNYKSIAIYHKPGCTIGAVRNAGASIASNQILAFIDADCVVCPNWRKHTIITLVDNNIGATGSKVDIPDDSVWIERAWYSQRDDKCTTVKYINSGNLVVRKSVFDEVGGFSEDLITGEDSELGWRIDKSGYLILNNPKIKATHLGNPKNLRKFYKKEKWHALGMLGTFKISKYDKPLITTVMFIMTSLFGLLLSISLIIFSHYFIATIVFIALSASIPIVTAVYRVIQFKNYEYFFHLICLYWVYFLARANVLITLICRDVCSYLGSK